MEKQLVQAKNREEANETGAVRNGCCRRDERGCCRKWHFYQNWQDFYIQIKMALKDLLCFALHTTGFGRTSVNISFSVLECDGPLFHQITLKVTHHFIF